MVLPGKEVCRKGALQKSGSCLRMEALDAGSTGTRTDEREPGRLFLLGFLGRALGHDLQADPAVHVGVDVDGDVELA